jgi:hypothetical protein
MSEKVLFIEKNFEAHARDYAYKFAYDHRFNEAQMQVIFLAIMNFIDLAVEQKKVEVKEQSSWDAHEGQFREAMDNEWLKRRAADGYSA